MMKYNFFKLVKLLCIVIMVGSIMPGAAFGQQPKQVTLCQIDDINPKKFSYSTADEIKDVDVTVSYSCVITMAFPAIDAHACPLLGNDNLNNETILDNNNAKVVLIKSVSSKNYTQKIPFAPGEHSNPKTSNQTLPMKLDISGKKVTPGTEVIRIPVTLKYESHAPAEVDPGDLCSKDTRNITAPKYFDISITINTPTCEVKANHTDINFGNVTAGSNEKFRESNIIFSKCPAGATSGAIKYKVTRSNEVLTAESSFKLKMNKVLADSFPAPFVGDIWRSTNNAAQSVDTYDIPIEYSFIPGKPGINKATYTFTTEYE